MATSSSTHHIHPSRSQQPDHTSRRREKGRPDEVHAAAVQGHGDKARPRQLTEPPPSRPPSHRAALPPLSRASVDEPPRPSHHREPHVLLPRSTSSRRIHRATRLLLRFGRGAAPSPTPVELPPRLPPLPRVGADKPL
ncbi:hypothetical protein ZWY2020_028933 [Hordeum vulgare]|nr:hypothetical protein ZWY2020_028933 [Hordeum vulgare]